MQLPWTLDAPSGYALSSVVAIVVARRQLPTRTTKPSHRAKGQTTVVVVPPLLPLPWRDPDDGGRMGGEGVLNEHIAMQRVATVPSAYHTTEFFILTVCGVCLDNEIRREWVAKLFCREK